mgnify:CR=1 FL=1
MRSQIATSNFQYHSIILALDLRTEERNLLKVTGYSPSQDRKNIYLKKMGRESHFFCVTFILELQRLSHLLRVQHVHLLRQLLPCNALNDPEQFFSVRLHLCREEL